MAIDNPRIRSALTRREITQQQLAAALGITQPQVSARLAGRVRWRADELATVAALVDEPLADFVRLHHPAGRALAATAA